MGRMNDGTTSFIALLRGINVGGRNRLRMADLVALFEGAGAESVRTYIQSGNVVFRSPAQRVARVVDDVRRGLVDGPGLDVPVVLRSAAELEGAVDANPFVAEGCDPAELHFGFLLDEPTTEAVASLDPARSDIDRFRVVGRELYLHVPGGLARTRLTTAWFDRGLETVVTVRNWRTVQKLLEMARSA